jgi:hypothetical protein
MGNSIKLYQVNSPLKVTLKEIDLEELIRLS